MTATLSEPALLPDAVAGMDVEVPVISLDLLTTPVLGDSCLCEGPGWRSSVEALYQAFDSVQAVRCEVGSDFTRLLEAAEAFFEQPSKQQYAPTRSRCLHWRCRKPARAKLRASAVAGSAALLTRTATGALAIRTCLSFRWAAPARCFEGEQGGAQSFAL